MHRNPASSAHVDLVTSNNQTFGDAIQVDPPVPGVTGPQWSMSGQKLRMDVAPNREQASLVSFLSDNGEIVIDDVTERIFHFNVPMATINAALIPGTYVYDLIMYDTEVPPRRVQIMHGKFIVTDGVTGA